MPRRNRTILTCFAVALPGLFAASCERTTIPHPRVIVLGFDGMDPRRCERLMDAGQLPNLARMRDAGGYRPLETSIPPQSPVAWASFITGANPGVHGIFDFIHRDPAKQCAPFYSAAETQLSEDGWNIGDHKLPLTFWPFNHAPTQTLLRRDGTPFWNYLDAAGIPVWMYDIPANYPPSESKHGHVCCLSGMGVPDLRGGYGEYQYFSERNIVEMAQEGGLRRPLNFRENAAKTSLVGVVNTLMQKPVDTRTEMRIYRHPTQDAARIEIAGKTMVLNRGEWSDWTQVEFELAMPPFLPNAQVSGIVRFYLKSVHPEFSLYASPINIDPMEPGETRITEPPVFIERIAEELGLFYTTGFQEDHKALSNKVFTDEEYKNQADYVLQERKNLLSYATSKYENGFLFFYFSSTDLQAHMFWWDSQEPHPTRSVEEAKKYDQVITDLYKDMDRVIGNVVQRHGNEALVLVMSDHGFANFKRQFQINTWLRDEGYIQPPGARSLLSEDAGGEVDWTRTRAYALGLNGLYLNLQGRERDGIVDPLQRDVLLKEIEGKLLAYRDPENGRPVVARVYRAEDVYNGPHLKNAPDLIIGYHRDYRVSWASTLGDIVEPVVSDNTMAWSADHCIAHDQVPGVIFANRPIARESPSLIDLAPTVLTEFGVRVPQDMKGEVLFRPAAATRTDRRGTAAPPSTSRS